MEKQTAVQWLIKELEQQKLIKLDKLSTILFNKNFATRYELIIEQAKALEKEQIIDAYDVGFVNAWDDARFDDEPKYATAEQYYNETYGDQETD